MEKLKILYLDDERDMRNLVNTTLSPLAEIHEAGTILEGMNLLKQENYNVIMVDLNLGTESGLEFVNFIKKKNFKIKPEIIVITGSSCEEQEALCHELEVSEFIKKPIRSKVLRAQIKKYLHKSKQNSLSVRDIGPLRVDLNKMQVRLFEEDLQLTLKEYRLLLKFIEHPGVVYTREQLYSEVWDANSATQSRTIDMHVSVLRKKLGRVGNAICSVRGIGYSFDISKAA